MHLPHAPAALPARQYISHLYAHMHGSLPLVDFFLPRASFCISPTALDLQHPCYCLLRFHLLSAQPPTPGQVASPATQQAMHATSTPCSSKTSSTLPHHLLQLPHHTLQRDYRCTNLLLAAYFTRCTQGHPLSMAFIQL